MGQQIGEIERSGATSKGVEVDQPREAIGRQQKLFIVEISVEQGPGFRDPVQRLNHTVGMVRKHVRPIWEIDRHDRQPMANHRDFPASIMNGKTRRNTRLMEAAQTLSDLPRYRKILPA